MLIPLVFILRGDAAKARAHSTAAQAAADAAAPDQLQEPLLNGTAEGISEAAALTAGAPSFCCCISPNGTPLRCGSPCLESFVVHLLHALALEILSLDKVTDHDELCCSYMQRKMWWRHLLG